MVWFINLSIPGYAFRHNALQATVKAAESISSCPERTCAFIISPNTGTFGDSYDEAHVRTANNDVEDLLKDPDLGIIYRPIALVYDESTLLTYSTRPGQHPVFMVISDKMTGSGRNVSTGFAVRAWWSPALGHMASAAISMWAMTSCSRMGLPLSVRC